MFIFLYFFKKNANNIIEILFYGGDNIKNYGVQNEHDFVMHFNKKHYCELDRNSQQFLEELFDEDIDDDEEIISWKNKSNQKADIFIKYKNYVKSISLKCGKSNSVHCESVQDFKRYLEKLNIPYKVINKYFNYHYGYRRDENEDIIFSKILSAKEYKVFYQNEIDIFNEYINKTKIIVDMIDRFIVRGRNSDYDIDSLVVGTVDNYVWIMKYDLYDLILSKKEDYYTSPHISCLTIGPKKRNIYGNSKNKNDRYLVCVRWNFIKESIIEFKNNKCI